MGDLKESMEQKNHHNEIETLKDRLILEQMNSFIVEYNLKTKECYIDPAQKKYVMGDWAKLCGQPKYDFRKLVLFQDREIMTKFFDFSNLSAGEQRTAKARFFVEPHRYEWFRMSLLCFGSSSGEGERVLITFSNVQKELAAIESLEFLMSKDPLTHLPNREMFVKLTRQMMEQNPEKHYVIIRMDVDKFRIINQFYGTKEGDNVLRYIGVKIREYMEAMECGTYTRISSDMFCLCTPDDQEIISEVIEYLQGALKAYPLNFDMNLSFGVYLTTDQDREEKVPIQDLMDRAAAAQRTVKSHYYSHVAFYDQQIKLQEMQERIILSEMKAALREHQFQVYLQPKCDMQTGRIVGSEALIRWAHPTRGMLSPGVFIPILERNGFISEVDYYMLESTCRLIRQWLDEGFPVQPISVNVSRMDLYNPKLMEDIQGCVGRYQIPHELIEFELTESAFVSDNQQLYHLAKALQENHFAVLMDDFGSGYSSLNSLREIPVDVLKIDIKFLPPFEGDERANIILRSVVDMAGKLGLKVVVEGVENKRQAEFLTTIGCRHAQGFFFYRPQPVHEFEKLMKLDPIPLSARGI